jgi:hypothetical protein
MISWLVGMTCSWKPSLTGALQHVGGQGQVLDPARGAGAQIADLHLGAGDLAERSRVLAGLGGITATGSRSVTSISWRAA